MMIAAGKGGMAVAINSSVLGLNPVTGKSGGGPSKVIPSRRPNSMRDGPEKAAAAVGSL